MRRPFQASVPAIAGLVAIAAPILGHAAPFLDPVLNQGSGVQLACAAIQALAIGIVVAATAPPPWRWLGAAIPAILLTGIAAGARHSPATGLLAAAGLTHAMLYTALLATFARSLAPGHEALVTRMARLANPNFHPGMVPYTRKVTAAWSALFAAQLAASAILLATEPDIWRAFVSGWHIATIPALMLAELLVRRIRFRHGNPSGLCATLQAIRAVRHPGSDARVDMRADIRANVSVNALAQDPAANRSTIP